MSCAVPQCTSSIDDLSVEYFAVPNFEEISKRWVEACGLQDTASLDEVYFCSVHFDKEAFITAVTPEGTEIRCLKEGAVPTLYLPTSQHRNYEHLPADYATELEGASTDSAKVKDSGNHMRVVLQNAALQDKIKSLQYEISVLSDSLKDKEEQLVELEKDYSKRISTVNRYDGGKQRQILSKVFSETQVKALFRKRAHWSQDDMAVAYTIRHLSNKRAYQYLTDNLHLPLPGNSSVKRWITFNYAKKSKDEKAMDNE